MGTLNSGQTFALLMTVVISGTCVVLGIVSAIVGRRKSNRKGLDPAVDFGDRLGRMEQAIDSIAIEVERVSEAQRFVTRVIADRKAAPQPSLPERVNTPR